MNIPEPILLDIAKTGVPIAISVIAIWVSLKDRRPKLALKSRKGKWTTVQRITTRREMGFAATIEVYNVSPRANAIREYRFWTKDEHDKWTMMESERYELSFNDGKEPRVFNHTPITLAPYSGIEVSIEAFTPLPKLNQVKVEIEDLFGKRYKLELSMEK